MTVLLVEPGKLPEKKEISGTLESMQEFVGGTIQAIYPFDEPVALICNDDGKLLNMEMNRHLSEIGDIISRSFFVVGAPPGARHFASLTEEQLARYETRFHFPELFLQMGDAVFVLTDQ